MPAVTFSAFPLHILSTNTVSTLMRALSLVQAVNLKLFSFEAGNPAQPNAVFSMPKRTGIHFAKAQNSADQHYLNPIETCTRTLSICKINPVRLEHAYQDIYHILKRVFVKIHQLIRMEVSETFNLLFSAKILKQNSF